MAISDYAARKFLNAAFNGAALGAAATWYVGFKSGGVELSGNAYARIALTADGTNFPVIVTGDTITNGVEFSTPTATPAAWDEADEVAIYDASSGGNEWFAGSLDAPFTLAIGQSRPFPAGSLNVRLI